MNAGWIRLHRQIRENEFWRQRRRFSKAEAWVDLLMDAAFEDHEAILGNTVIPIKRGQALISQRAKAGQWGWARNTVHSFLSLLARREMVSHEMNRGPEGGYTLVTIKNYGRFQSDDEPSSSGQLSHGQSHALSHERATIEPRLEQSEEGKEGKEVKKGIAGALPAPADGDGKGPQPGRKPRKTHPETDTLLSEFGTLFEKKWGTPYLASFARDKKLLHDLLTASGVEEVRARMTAFLAYGTKRTRDLADYSIPSFRAAWNEIGVLKARGDL